MHRVFFSVATLGGEPAAVVVFCSTELCLLQPLLTSLKALPVATRVTGVALVLGIHHPILLVSRGTKAPPSCSCRQVVAALYEQRPTLVTSSS